MADDRHEVEAAMAGSAEVPKSDYLRWARSPDLAVQARAFHLSSTAWNRISPEPTMDEQCELMTDYLLACISRNPPPDDPDDYLHFGFEAGLVLAACLKHWSGFPEAPDIIPVVAKKLERLYRESDAQGRNRIETGALEHILEARRLRRYFDYWAQDLELREAFEHALAWGLAHSDDGQA
jgi:hypothetical protein